MDPGRPTGKGPPIPSRRSTGGSVAGRQPTPECSQSSPNASSGTPQRDQGNPQKDSKDRPDPTPPSLNTPSSPSTSAPAPFPASSTPSNTCQKCNPAKFGEEPPLMCVPAELVDLSMQHEALQSRQESDPEAIRQPPAFGRQSTYTRQEANGQQDVNEYTVTAEKRPPEIGSQRTKSPLARPSSKLSQKYQSNQQKPTSTTELPRWRGPNSACKPPPPVSKPKSSSFVGRKQQSETEVLPNESQMSANQSRNSTRQSQISGRESQQASARQSQACARHTQLIDNRSQLSSRPHHSSSANMPSPRKPSSHSSDFASIISAAAQQGTSTYSHLSRSTEAARVSSPVRSGDNFQNRGQNTVVVAPVQRSWERVYVENAEGLARRSFSRPIPANEGNVRSDVENAIGPNRRSAERLHQECSAIMQKLTAELAVPTDVDQVCVHISLSEHLTAGGENRYPIVSDPPPAEQCQDESTEVYATPTAPSPRMSVPPVAHLEELIQEATAEEVSEHECTNVHEEEYHTASEPSDAVRGHSIQEVSSLPSIEEILPPPAENILHPPTAQVAPMLPDYLYQLPVKPWPPSHAEGNLNERLKEPEDHPDIFPVHLDRESSTGNNMKTAENEALSTEFLYYSSVLKNLLPVLSCPENRCRLIPWVKKLFSPEYCARLLRDKRNRFLLQLALILCNDEVIGVFRNPPPEGTIPSVDDLCSFRYPPAAWECDCTWVDHLEETPPGFGRMPCPWHSSGCPPLGEMPAAATDSTKDSTCQEVCQPASQYGTSNEAAFGWSLDQEFKMLLYLSRSLKPLMEVSRDRQRFATWIRYLCTVTPDCCVALRSLRNDYAKLLLAYGQDDRMTGPFANDPVWGQALPPLGADGDADRARPFGDPTSGDVDEFLRTVRVPNEGAFCYVAIDGIPLTSTARPTPSASLLKR